MSRAPVLCGHTSSCLLSPPTELPTGLARHSSGHLAFPTRVSCALGCWFCHQLHPVAGKQAGASLGSIFSSSPPSRVPPSCLKANCCRIWLFQSQLSLERDLLTTGVTCAAQRNETHSQRLRGTEINVLQQDLPPQKSAPGSCSIPRACD